MRRSPALIALLVLFATGNLTFAQDQPLPDEQQLLEAEDAAVPLEAEPAELPDAAPASEPPSDVALPEEAAAAVNPNPLSSLSLEGLSTTLSAPLFTPSRTAPAVEAPIAEIAPAPEPEVGTEEQPPALRLVGIVMSDAAKTAVLVDQGTNEVHRLASGEEYEGWALTVVDARSIEFRSGDRVEELKMFESFPTPASYTPPAEAQFEDQSSDMQPEPGMEEEISPEAVLNSEPVPFDPSAMPSDEMLPEEELEMQGVPPGEPSAEQVSPENFDPQLEDTLIPEEGLPPDANAQ